MKFFFVNEWSGRGMLPFFIGVMLGNFCEHTSERRLKEIACCSLCILSFFLAVAFVFRKPGLFGNLGQCMNFFIAPTLILSAMYVNLLKKILRLKLFLAVSDLSFAIYLVHPFINSVLTDIQFFSGNILDMRKNIVLIVSLIAVLLCSNFFNVFIENKLPRYVLRAV